LFDLPKYGEGIGLARMADLLDAVAVDRARLRRVSVVVTGSNGKGSTAAFCASIAQRYGLRTGSFTSPHLHRFNERFQVDGIPIDDDALARLTLRIEAAIAELSQRRHEKFGAFEAMFALACLYFQESECDFVVLEAGIGGRYDPVRLVGAHVTCVTSVDYEHVELLGDSLELIVSDKSDACASGGTVVYGENCRSLRPHLLEYNRNREVTSLFVRDDVAIDNEASSATAQLFDLRFKDSDFRALETSLLGAFQVNNAAIAVTLFLLWLRRTRPGESAADIEAAVRSGLREACWPGRLEVIQQQPLTVIDVGHTPDGIRQSLASPTRSPLCWRHRSARSFAPRPATRARARQASPPQSRKPIRPPAFRSPPPSKTPSASAKGSPRHENKKYTWPADCSWRSNTRPSRAADARRTWIFSDRTT
jgi:dihydrofolate synthase / folylpolyglutamate synthase